MAQHLNQHEPTTETVLPAFPFLKKDKQEENNHPPSSPNGGQTTIRPPANVNELPHTPYTPNNILASGIDTLYLAVNIYWENENFFELLTEHKKQAALHNEPQTLVLDEKHNPENRIFLVRANGAKRYQWLIENHEYSIKIGNWMEPKQLPSAIVEIRSETLWSHGPIESVNRIIDFLERQGAFIKEIKPSRVDLCIDILLDEHIWTMDLINYSVTRASYAAPHFSNKQLTGISLGKGHIVARLYDKPLEIKQKKKKTWMYDIWGIKSVPHDKKIVRVEFQLRRQALNDLYLHTINDLFENHHHLWGYCTQKWLKFQDNPEKHHTQRITFDWWVEVQNGFLGHQKPNPLIRVKAIQEDIDRLGDQAIGLLSSMHAIQKKSGGDQKDLISIKDIIQPLMGQLFRRKKNADNFQDEVNKKMAQRTRDKVKEEKVRSKRSIYGFPYQKPKPIRIAPKPEPKDRQPRRHRPQTDTASEKPTCHRLVGNGSTDADIKPQAGETTILDN
jgi:hypothetical protein